MGTKLGVFFKKKRKYHPMEETFEFVQRFGAGVNLGNTLDAPDGETSWGNPKISRELVHFYRKEGFRSIRIPVSWEKHFSRDDFVIDDSFLNRVHEVVSWCLDEGFITILNLHHEGGWLSPDKEASATGILICIWRQIANCFTSCGERLVFEAFNEIRNGDDWGGTPDSCESVNRLAARFVETVRSTGGSNKSRYLMIPTYAASAGETACCCWKPVENDNRLIATVHCYAPHEFTHQSNGQKEYHPAWCRPELESVFQCLKRHFLDRGVPIVIGEAGVNQKNGVPNESGRIAWAHDVATLSARHGIPLIVWEDGGDFQLVDRANVKWTHPLLATEYLASSSC